MAYIVPRVLINQEFTQVPVFGDAPLAALIIGPQYKLFRYDVADEKPDTMAYSGDTGNAYVSGADTVFEFPNRPAGAHVDPHYTKVFFENVQAQYFPNSSLGSASGTVTRVTVPNSSPTKYFTNRLQSSALVFKTANGSNRSSVFSNRDVKVGDAVELSDGTTVATSKVRALYATKTSATVGTPTQDAANVPTQVAAFANAPTWVGSGSAPSGRVTLSNDSTAYVGYNEKRVLADTYTFEVTTGGNTSAVKFKVSSAAGVFTPKTDVSLVTVSSDADILWLDNTGTNAVRIDFTSSTSFVVGDKWTVSVAAAATQQTPTSGGTFTDAPHDISYKLTVVRGGPFYDGSNAAVCARVSVTSNDIDSSPTVNVTSGTAFDVGSYGTTVTFSSAVANGGLILGDVYYVSNVASTDGAVNIIETINDLPAGFLANTGTWTLKLSKVVPTLEVGASKSVDNTDFNWEVDTEAETVTLNAGIVTSDPSLVVGGELVDLAIVKATVFIQHRDLLVDNTLSISSLADVSSVERKLGVIHPDNPLAQGVYNAALNAGGVTVYYVGVASDDLEGYSKALELAKKDNTYHGITPLTFDRTVQDLVVSHVNAMSSAENAKWRVAWLSAPLALSELLYDLNSDGDAWLATVTDDPNVNGTNLNLLKVTGGTFVTDGVRPKDEVRMNFRLSPTGKVLWDTYIVDEVKTEEKLTLTTPVPTAVTTPVKVQIARSFTKDEQVAALSHVAGDYNNRRVRMIFPDTVKNGNLEQPGYQVAAAMAGLRSGVVPHQGLTNTEVLGFTDVSKASVEFTEDQLNVLAAQGMWIMSQTVPGATPYVRHQLTTDEKSLNTSEDSPTANVDNISYGLQRVLAPFIGRYNRNKESVAILSDLIFGELNFRQTSTYTVRAGNQLNGFKIVSLQPNLQFKDRLDVLISLDIPYPYNFINVTLVV